jgi:hypothetical protein
MNHRPKVWDYRRYQLRKRMVGADYHHLRHRLTVSDRRRPNRKLNYRPM